MDGLWVWAWVCGCGSVGVGLCVCVCVCVCGVYMLLILALSDSRFPSHSQVQRAEAERRAQEVDAIRASVEAELDEYRDALGWVQTEFRTLSSSKGGAEQGSLRGRGGGAYGDDGVASRSPLDGDA